MYWNARRPRFPLGCRSRRRRSGSAPCPSPDRYRRRQRKCGVFHPVLSAASGRCRGCPRPHPRSSWRRPDPRGRRSSQPRHNRASPPPAFPPVPWSRPRSDRWAKRRRVGWHCGSGSPKGKCPPCPPFRSAVFQCRSRSGSRQSPGRLPPGDCWYSRPSRRSHRLRTDKAPRRGCRPVPAPARLERRRLRCRRCTPPPRPE